MKRQISAKQLVESGVLLALGFVLSVFKIKLVAVGGSVTLASMLPIVILAYKYGPGWGTLCGFVHAMLQIIEDGGIAPPVRDAQSFLLVFLLDFALAWAVVGLLAGLLRGVSEKPQRAIAVGALAGVGGRFLCSFLSGMIIWGVYAPQGQSVALYSLAVNASYMVPEMLVTSVLGYLLFSVPVLQKQVALEAR